MTNGNYEKNGLNITLHTKSKLDKYALCFNSLAGLSFGHSSNVLCIFKWLFLFSVLGSFVMAQRSDVVVCVENEHCQTKPMCERHDACAVSWFQGIGTQNSVLRSERTAIDLEG